MESISKFLILWYLANKHVLEKFTGEAGVFAWVWMVAVLEVPVLIHELYRDAFLGHDFRVIQPAIYTVICGLGVAIPLFHDELYRKNEQYWLSLEKSRRNLIAAIALSVFVLSVLVMILAIPVVESFSQVDGP